MKTLKSTHRLQLLQLYRLDPKAAQRAESLLADGYVDAARRKIVAAMKRALVKLANPTPTAPPAPLPADWDKLPRTAAESIAAMLGQDYQAERERLAEPGRMSKPTPEQAQWGLEDALRPGGGRFNPVHRPKAQFGK